MIHEPPGAGGDGKLDPADARHGTRKLLNLDAPVYVDGEQVAVLRWGDLPSMPFEMLEGETPSYRLYDYLTGIGLDPKTIKSVHLHGNNDRIGSVEGSELVKEKDRFTFTFSSQTTGAPLQRWDTEGLKNEFVVHEIRKVSVFVKKAPIAIHPTRRCHLGSNGECTTAMPYAEREPAKGTRVYVDGRMVGFVKRRLLGSDLIVGKSAEGEDKYSVSKFIASLGVDASGVKAVEFVAGDDVIARASAEQWSKLAPALTFTLPKHQHGKVRANVPGEIRAEAPASPRDALVSAVVLYKTTAPAKRDLVEISEDTDLSVLLASNDEPREETSRGER